MIFYKYSDAIPDIKERVDMAVFPALQGGPHNHQIAALATQLREVATPEFRSYSEQVVRNCRAMAEELVKLGNKLATGGTDNHLLLWDLRPFGLTGNKLEKVCDAVGISLNRNTLHGDKSALAPGGVRIGSPAMTTRGCTEDHFRAIARFLNEAAQIAVAIQETHGKKMVEFAVGINESNEGIRTLRSKVDDFACSFPFPGL
jgi:glycine hydroxymethyltransferase